MIRVVHIISSLDTGGAERMLAKLVGAMDRTLFQNVVISLTDRGRLGDAIASSGVPVHCLGMQRGRPDILALPRLIRHLRALQPMIVQSWLYHADLLSTLAVKCVRRPVLVWNVRCSDMDFNQYRFLTRLVLRMLAHLSAAPGAVIVNSEAGKRQHEQAGYRPRRWQLIPNGFDTQQFRPDSGIRSSLRKDWQIPERAVIVALVARVDPMKDHATFLNAAQQIAESRQNAHFLLVGKDTETLAPVIRAKGLTDRVRVLGYRGDVERLLPAVDVLCLSSAFGEGFPNVLGEGMACGIPCVSTDVGDARSIIGDTGAIVPVRDPEAMARAVIDLIDRGSGDREKLGQAARARIQTEYSLAGIVERYCALYSELASAASLTH